MNERQTDGDRPKPEAFLRQAAQEGRGRLKVFLGAAPGVGKTYEMLNDGMQRKRAGVDVVRMNFSHGTAQDHMGRAEKVRAAAAACARSPDEPAR